MAVVVASSGAAAESTPALSSEETLFAPGPSPLAAVLFDQTDLLSSIGITSQNFEPSLDAFDSEGAADFEVPEGETWLVDTVAVIGIGSLTPTETVNVRFYEDAGGAPGALSADALSVPPSSGLDTGDLVIPLPRTERFTGGRYWVSVQVNKNFNTSGQWFWQQRVRKGGVTFSAWRNIPDGFNRGCSDWRRTVDCDAEGEPDFAFQLGGTKRGTATAPDVDPRFVQRVGDGFYLDGRPFRFVGVNMRELVHLWYFQFGNTGDAAAATETLYHQLAEAARMGVSVVRVYLPREEKQPATFDAADPDGAGRAAYHKEIGDLLVFLLDFATAEAADFADVPNPTNIDYRPFRSGGPPAPGMKFLITLTDNIYARDKGYDPAVTPCTGDGTGGSPSGPNANHTLRLDRCAYTRQFLDASGNDLAPNLRFLEYSWFRAEKGRRNVAVDYEDNYKPMVIDVVSRLKDDPRIFAWELGNELQAENVADMEAFLLDMTDAVRNRRRGADANHMITTGFVSAWHAAGADTAAAADLYGNRRIGLDFGSVHMYNNEWNSTPCSSCSYVYQRHDLDLDVFESEGLPYIVGELGFDGGHGNPAVDSFPGGTWQDAGHSIDITYENNTSLSRRGNIAQTLGALFDHRGADGVFQWAFVADDRAAPFIADGRSGMDRNPHDDFEDLFDVYGCRAAALETAGRGPMQIDLAIQRIVGTNLSAGGQPPAAGDDLRFRIHVCNAGDVITYRGVGLSLFLDNDGANPTILHPIGNVFVGEDLAPGQVTTLELDWTVAIPPGLGITLDNAVIVGLVDDVNRYADEITEANNGFAVDLQELPPPDTVHHP